MLTRTFCHIPGIGPASERKLWQAGIHTWDHLRDASRDAKPPLAAGKMALALDHLERSRQALQDNDAEFFAACLPAAEQWRLFPDFQNSVAYVDIETTGLSWPEGQITAIALYDGHEAKTYVQGRNLQDFEADIAAHRLLVTFNGKCFDVPFLERHFRINLPKAHVDLRYVLKALGLTGGLKACEKRLGLDRAELDGVDGYFAVLLWHEWENYADEAALETLLAYNVADVIGLESLLAHAVNLRLETTPFTGLDIPLKPLAGNPHRAHPEVIQRLKDKMTARFPWG